MIELAKGNLLEAQVDALVNTVNTVGVMGKGIALQFKQAFPENYKEYRRACEHSQLRPGRMFVVPTHVLTSPRFIINFPTKRHWKGKSRIEDIEAGLRDLVTTVRHLKVKSIAVPPLGCGNGGLDWSVVRPLIFKYLESLKDVRVLVFEPHGAPHPDQMQVRTARPKMTAGRAALLKALQAYGEPGYKLTLLEVQKLAYFLQEAGETLRLLFKRAHYGPYAESLNHVLQCMEGHFTRGYGDRSGEASIGVLPEAQQGAEAFLAEHPELEAPLLKVRNLIRGFETPYGMELLATVHWVAHHEERSDLGSVTSAVMEWSPRKRHLFTPPHVSKAWRHLREQGWLSSSESPVRELNN